ncbi:MAG: hypothetical protein K0Q68_2819 [Moraxellaceae bacterium]|jgi:tol-pal system protein YbgF|nr:hypothetical protein [Moraxellaceae bacterium]
MNRFRLAILPSLLLAAAVARAEIPVEERPLSAPVARPAQVAANGAGAAAGTAASPAPGTPGGSGNGGGMWEQYTQVEQLQQQIQTLQGLLEQQGFQLEKLQNDLRVRYTDLDQRLNGLQEQMQQQQQAAPVAGGEVPGASGTAASPTLEDEKRAYLAAYDTFRVGGPDKAIPPMLAFVKRYPNSTFVPSAYYWLGEFYLNASTPDQDAAQKQFDIVLSNYPNSPKASAALYKTGALLDLRGKPQEARKRMQELLQKYPKSSEAALAQSYIDALDSASKPVAAESPAPQAAAKPVGSKTGKAAPKSSTRTTSRKKN